MGSDTEYGARESSAFSRNLEASAAAGWVCPARSSASHVPHAPFPSPAAPPARPRPPANGIDGTSLLPQRHRWNIAVAGRGEAGRPRAAGAKLAGRVRLTGHTGPGTAGADTAPGYRRDSLLTEGSCQGKRNLPRH
jgi:hypothetical protein